MPVDGIPKAISDFQVYMIGANEAVSVYKNVNVPTRKGTIGQQKGEPTQNTFKYVGLKKKVFRFKSYGGCGHLYLLHVGFLIQDVSKINDQVRKDVAEKLKNGTI